MPIQPGELLSLATELSGQQSSFVEGLKRCVVSRAYYAALHAVDETFPADDEGRLDGESSHAEIIRRAVAHGNRIGAGRTDARQIANMMPRLRRFRNVADYKIAQSLDEDEYASVLARSNQIIKLCQSVQQSVSKAEATAEEKVAASPQNSSTELDPLPPHSGGPASRPPLTRIK